MDNLNATTGATRFSYKVPLIVCSNDFWAGCTNNAAKEWIELNSIYLRIESEVWVKPAEAES